MKKTAVVILNWNGKKFLEQFLPSVTKYSSHDARIVVADNQSTDDSIQFIQDNYPEIEIIVNDKNYGFAKGYNVALKQVDAEYFVLLNSDVEVTENWITPIIQLMDSNLNIAACQPKIKDFYKKEYFEYAGAAGGFIDYLGYPLCRGRIFNTLEKDNGQFNDTSEIFWATGAALFIRAKLFKEINGFDEQFFAHMEEIDLCWRLKNLGYQIMYCSESIVYHVGGGTLNKINPKKTYLNFRNNLLVLHKNLQKNKRFKILFLRLILDGMAGIKLLFEGKPKHTFAIIQAHFSFYSRLKENRKKRNRVTSPNLFGIIPKSTLLASFLLNKKTFKQIIEN
ncbi:MAG: glycosyltransferase family 2 protein [Flavobacteriales bacterium]|nr:glycosyltransferase family 2 protein [Flavobacteriales bacterium]